MSVLREVVAAEAILATRALWTIGSSAALRMWVRVSPIEVSGAGGGRSTTLCVSSVVVQYKLFSRLNFYPIYQVQRGLALQEQVFLPTTLPLSYPLQSSSTTTITWTTSFLLQLVLGGRNSLMPTETLEALCELHRQTMSSFIIYIHR